MIDLQYARALVQSAIKCMEELDRLFQARQQQDGVSGKPQAGIHKRCLSVTSTLRDLLDTIPDMT